MEYLSKSMRLDSEVVEWLDRLKEAWGSYNKGLRKVAFHETRGAPVIDVTAKREPLPTFGVPPLVLGSRDTLHVSLDAVSPGASPSQGKATTEVVRRPLREKGDGKR